MDLSELSAISPLDGRYRNRLLPLVAYFSEFALIQYRIEVEVEYFIALQELGIPPLNPLSDEVKTRLRDIYHQFDVEAAKEVKAIERKTNHDVKAVEYYIKSYLESDAFGPIHEQKEFVHFGLTSQDINNTAIPLMLKGALENVYIPSLNELLSSLEGKIQNWESIAMLARTHGQPASPTYLGKELEVFYVRLSNAKSELMQTPFPAKFGGATGNFNAHYIAYPNVNWHEFAHNFVENQLGLKRSFPTTQIDHYDGLGRIFDAIKRINTILIDMCQDFWLYISMEYFHQEIKEGEVGSSAMPHKVNPIDFENAEGNCGIGIALLEYLSRKLPISRLQRDLSDSTILRNIGVALGHSLLSLKSIAKGLSKLRINQSAISQDLVDQWIILAEAVQTILRREGVNDPYEKLRDFTRGKANISKEQWMEFVNSLEISKQTKVELLELTPEKYTGK